MAALPSGEGRHAVTGHGRAADSEGREVSTSHLQRVQPDLEIEKRGDTPDLPFPRRLAAVARGGEAAEEHAQGGLVSLESCVDLGRVGD